MLNPFGTFSADTIADPHNGGISPTQYMTVVPQQVLPNALYFETPGGSINMAASVIGAEALPATATATAPGQVPIAIDAGGTGIIQDAQGGGGEESTIATFLPASMAHGYTRGRSWLSARTHVPVVGPVPNWILALGAGLVVLRAVRG